MSSCVFVSSWFRGGCHADLRHQPGARGAAREARDARCASPRARRSAVRGRSRLADEQGVVVRAGDGRRTLDRAARGGVHQGVVADVEDAATCSVEDLVSGATRRAAASSCSTASRIRTTSARSCGRSTRRAPMGSSGSRGMRRRLAGRRRRRRPARWRTSEDRRGREHRAGDREPEGRRRLDGRAGGRCPEALRRYRLDAADGVRGRARRATGLAAAGAGAVRLARVDSDAGTCSKFERVGGDRYRPVRGGSPAAREMSTIRRLWSCSRMSGQVPEWRR